MATETYDLIVLGAGSAARDGAGKATREHGARVAIVESTRGGGSCPNVACRPTKAYLVAAELLHDIRSHAAKRGIDVFGLATDRAGMHSPRTVAVAAVECAPEEGPGVAAPHR